MAPDKKQGETWTESVILRNNSGMVRDFWYECEPPNNRILVIRQVRFAEDGQSPTSKQIRLEESEVRILWEAISLMTGWDTNALPK